MAHCTEPITPITPILSGGQLVQPYPALKKIKVARIQTAQCLVLHGIYPFYGFTQYESVRNMPATLLLKLFLVPALIYIVTMAGRKWGPTVAGWMAAFPVVAGPILMVFTAEHGVQFGSRAAQGTLLAVLAVLTFNLVYVWASARFTVVGSMVCALLAWALALSGLRYVQLAPEPVFAIVLFALLVAPQLFPHLPARLAETGTAPNDLPWRMLLAMLLVLLVTFSAAHLGPRMSGFLAMFPVMSIVLTGFSHRYSGRAFAVSLLRGIAFGYFSFATFCFVLIKLLPTQAVAIAFIAAFGCALMVQISVKLRLVMASKR